MSKFDERIMPEEDLTEFYEDFDHVDGININEIDPKSKEFEALPIATQYMILSHLRLKSRLRMGIERNSWKNYFQIVWISQSFKYNKFKEETFIHKN